MYDDERTNEDKDMIQLTQKHRQANKHTEQILHMYRVRMKFCKIQTLHGVRACCGKVEGWRNNIIRVAKGELLSILSHTTVKDIKQNIHGKKHECLCASLNGHAIPP